MSDKDRADEKKAYADALAQLSNLQSRFDVSEVERDEHKTRADKAEGEVDTLRERVTVLEAARADDKSEDLLLTIKGLNAQLEAEKSARMDAESPERLVEAVKARVALETSVLAVFGDNDRSRMDGSSDRAVMELVIHKLHNAKIDEDKSDDYVRARFDAAVEGFMCGAKALANIRQAATPDSNKPEGERVDARSARQKMVDRNRNAWQPKPADASA